MKPIRLDMNDPLTLGLGHPAKERIKRLTVRKTNKFMRRATIFFILAVVGATTPISSTMADDTTLTAAVQVHDDGLSTSIDFDLTQGSPTVQVEIDGRQYIFLVAPAYEGSVLLKSKVAKELGLKDKGRVEARLHVDGEIFDMKARKIALKINEGEVIKRRVFWNDAEDGLEFDGIISGPSLGFDRVSFSRPLVAGKKYYPQTFKTFSRRDWGVPVKMHNDLSRKAKVVFAPHLEFSRADLVLAQYLKQKNFLQLEGETVVELDHVYGVQRQAAKVAFRDPLKLMGQTIKTSHVQVHSSTLEAGRVESGDVVIATGSKKISEIPRFLMSLDALGDCVKVEYTSRKVHVHCAVPP